MNNFQKMRQIDHQKVVCAKICDFISKRKDIFFLNFEIPDENERNKKAIDMLCYGKDTEIVIEHTRIESFSDQIVNGIRMVKLLKPLENLLTNKLPMPGHYELSMKSNEISGIRNENKIRLALIKWIKEKAPLLEIGSPTTAPRHFIREITHEIPFEVSLYRWPGLDGRFLFSQFIPDDLKERRKERLHKAIEEKCPKLSCAKQRDNVISVLVLESNDIALGNHVDIGFTVIEEIYLKEKDIPDEIYLIETEIDPWVIWILKEKSFLFPEVINCGPHYID